MFTQENDAHIVPTVEERRLAELQAIRQPMAKRNRLSFILWFLSIGMFMIGSEGMSEGSDMSNFWDYVGVASLGLWIVSLIMWLSVKDKLKAINSEIAVGRAALGLPAGEPLPVVPIGSPAPAQTLRSDGFYGLDLRHLSTVVDAHDADTLILNFKYRPQLLGSPAFHGLLDQLGINATATVARLCNTRALDGTQSTEGTGARAYWTYHPDEGLKVIFERM